MSCRNRVNSCLDLSTGFSAFQSFHQFVEPAPLPYSPMPRQGFPITIFSAIRGEQMFRQIFCSTPQWFNHYEQMRGLLGVLGDGEHGTTFRTRYYSMVMGYRQGHGVVWSAYNLTSRHCIDIAGAGWDKYCRGSHGGDKMASLLLGLPSKRVLRI